MTFGSPLSTLYSWAFPAYLPPAAFAQPAGGTAGLGELLWRNVFYPTDYIGGPVAGEVDVRLSDPPSDVYVYGQPTPPVLTHTGYWRDDRLWRQVDETAADLVRRSAAGVAPAADRV